MAKDLLLELGTEELPPLRLQAMSDALGESLAALFKENKLEFSGIKTYCAPRRLAVLVKDLSTTQPDTEQVRKGPAKQAAFDAEGNPTKAVEGFARSCGLSVDELDEIETDKGTWLGATIKTKGKTTESLIPEFFKQALDKLPIAKRMRWGNLSDEFVRPVHWIVALFGDDVVPMTLFNVSSGAQTYGHRFHAPEAVTITAPSDYESLLEKSYVVVDSAKRKDMIRSQVAEVAKNLGGTASMNEILLDEVASLVEYPVAISGGFDKKFLEVPSEATVAFMEGHQKFFAVFDNAGNLLPHFITVSNIQSKQPEAVSSGNERVIRPRLSDALFFWEQDLKTDLDAQAKRLETVVYQKQLGTVYEKTQRVAELSVYIASLIAADEKTTARAAQLAKADLLSNMVGEFPKLQGTMGRYYAAHAGEDDAVSMAIEEHYLPRYSGDILPASKVGQAVAIADRIDTLVGIFGIGQSPTGDKDPFGLRRAALGVLRIITEKDLVINLETIIQKSADLLGDKIDAADAVLPFMMDRFKHMEQEKGVSAEVFSAVHVAASGDLLDFIKREQAVLDFADSEVAARLSQANKRIANVLKKAKDVSTDVSEKLLEAEEEKALYQAAMSIKAETESLVQQADYQAALTLLSSLSGDIDAFFDKVMVMCDDEALKNNRLALLATIRDMFMQVADLSKLG